MGFVGMYIKNLSRYNVNIVFADIVWQNGFINHQIVLLVDKKLLQWLMFKLLINWAFYTWESIQKRQNQKNYNSYMIKITDIIMNMMLNISI